MPPKSKRHRLSSEAASVGREKLKEKRLSDSTAGLTSDAGPSSSSNSESPTTEPSEATGASQTTSPESSPTQIMTECSEEWLKVLDRDDKKSLAMFLCYNLSLHFQLTYTQAAEVAATMINKSDRSVRQWRKPRLHAHFNAH